MATTINKTVKSTGGDFSSLSAWESDQQADLVTLDEIRQAECFGFLDTAECDVLGWTTDATRYIRIYAAAGAEAQLPYDTSGTAYRLEVTNANSQEACIAALELFVRIEHIQVKLIRTSASGTRSAISYVSSGSGAVARVKGVVLTCEVTGGSGSNVCLNGDQAGITVKFNNCVVFDTFDVGVTTINASPVFVYNCSVINVMTGYSMGGGGAGRYKNCGYESQGVASADGFNGTAHGSSTNNASDIASDAPGSNPQTGSPAFIDEGNDDFHLASSDTLWKNNGADLSGDADLAFSDDFEGDTRSGTWDIGADEVVAIGATNQLLLSTRGRHGAINVLSGGMAA